MGVFRALADVLCDYWDYKEEQDRLYEEQRQEQLRKEKAEKEHQKFLREQAEHELWLKITEESHKNPDEFRVLPYGWSPFGIVL